MLPVQQQHQSSKMADQILNENDMEEEGEDPEAEGQGVQFGGIDANRDKTTLNNLLDNI